MYCPNCDLEIKGEGQDRCPICDTALIENPFESMLSPNDLSDTEQQLKELIRDIDEKVRDSIENSSNNNIFENHVFSLEGSEEGNLGPAPDEFELHLEERKESIGSDISEESIFGLPDENKPESELSTKAFRGAAETSRSSSEPFEVLSLKDTLNTSEEMPFPKSSSDTSEGFLKKESTIGTEGFDVPSEKKKTSSDVSNTQKILAETLEDFEPNLPRRTPQKKKTLSVAVLVGVLLLVAVVSAVLYFLNTFELSLSTFSQKPTALPAIKKLRSHSPSVATTAETSFQSASTDSLQSPKTASSTEEATISLQEQAVKEEDKKKQVYSSIIASEPQTTPEDFSAGNIDASMVQQTSIEPEKVTAKQSESAEIPQQLETPPQKPSTGESQKSLSGNFSIHSGSYRTSHIAQKEVRRLKAKGFDAFMEKVELGEKGVWYRVKIGVFTSKEQADQVLSLFLKKEKGEARIVKNR